MPHLHRGMNDKPTVPAISLTAAALELIAREASQSLDGLETGGILLGTETPQQISIRHAGDPGPHARRGPRNFLRDLDHAQQLANTAWQEDGSQWIGEWHTHPSTDLIPSDLDLDSYLRHLYDPDLRLDRFVTIIVGPQPNGGISAVTWLITRHHVHAMPLTTNPSGH